MYSGIRIRMLNRPAWLAFEWTWLGGCKAVHIFPCPRSFSGFLLEFWTVSWNLFHELIYLRKCMLNFLREQTVFWTFLIFLWSLGLLSVDCRLFLVLMNLFCISEWLAPHPWGLLFILEGWFGFRFIKILFGKDKLEKGQPLPYSICASWALLELMLLSCHFKLLREFSTDYLFCCC